MLSRPIGDHNQRACFQHRLVTILMVIDIISAIVSLIWFQTSQTVTSSIIAIIVSVIVLALLWNRRASEFFAA
jgi:uncharacterized membrane-anchored protein YitT (DUF2179 family)